jgi:hypothetical protein
MTDQEWAERICRETLGHSSFPPLVEAMGSALTKARAEGWDAATAALRENGSWRWADFLAANKPALN